jgi:hypothetical protein
MLPVRTGVPKCPGRPVAGAALRRAAWFLHFQRGGAGTPPGRFTVRSERGAGRIGVFIWLVLMAIAIFIAARTIPVRLHVLEFHDYVDEQTRYAAASRNLTENEVRLSILEKARELELPLDPKQLRYDKKKNEIIVRVKHAVTVDLEVYEWTWAYDRQFEHVRF